MEANRQDHKKVVEFQQQQRAAEMMPLVRLVAGASPVMEALTHDENWDRYLSYLQGMITRWTVSRDAARDKLANGLAWKHEEMLKLKADAMVADGMIQAWQVAIDLPKAIMSGKDEAEQLIIKYQEKFEHEE